MKLIDADTLCKAALWARKVNPVGKYKYCWSCGAKMGGDVNDA